MNLSFLGMDKLERRLARFLAPAAALYPGGSVKRFTTWMPLLIPFYIPRGSNWDYAWSQAEAIAKSRPSGGLLTTIVEMPLSGKLLLLHRGGNSNRGSPTGPHSKAAIWIASRSAMVAGQHQL